MHMIAFVQYLLGIGKPLAEHGLKLRHRLPRPWREISRIAGQVRGIADTADRLVTLDSAPSACPIGRDAARINAG